jgi:hypothetical protein
MMEHGGSIIKKKKWRTSAAAALFHWLESRGTARRKTA